MGRSRGQAEYGNYGKSRVRSRTVRRTWARRRDSCVFQPCATRGGAQTVLLASGSVRKACLRADCHVIVRRFASLTLRWPSMQLLQVGELASSKSAMKTLAPEFNALITILRSVGPVISTRRSSSSSGIGGYAPISIADVRGFGVEPGKAAAVVVVLALAAFLPAGLRACSQIACQVREETLWLPG